MSLPRLPACQLCRDRKSKCDNKRPSCDPCTKAGVECFMIVADTDDRITRQNIHELEQKQTTLGSPDAPAEVGSAQVRTGSEAHNAPGPAEAGSNLSGPSTESPEFGGGGLGFMTRLFANPEWRENHADLLHNLSRSIALAESAVRPSGLPNSSDARICFDKYLSGTHVQCPILLRADVQRLYSRVFGTERTATPSSHDLYRTFMILALGSITLYRNKQSAHHPFGFYLSAMENFKSQFLACGLNGIQDLQMITRFGIYYHIGTSLWEINRTSMRMCTELGLHYPSTGSISLIEEQLRRRVFWQCYLIDRYSSTILDRPFAIADCDVKADLPMDANDNEIQAAAETYTDLSSIGIDHAMSWPTEMTVFRHCIRLRQISSTIHRSFAKYQRFSGPESSQAEVPFLTGEIYSSLSLMLDRLQEWHKASPMFDSPRCLYEMSEWYDFLHVREQLQMIRKALDLVPKRRGLPPKDLLSLCLESAIQVISIFSRLYERRLATYTRSYFSSMFTSGLSIMLCVSLASTAEELRGVDSATALAACEKTLRVIGKELPDTRHYVAVFEVLNRNTSNKIRRFLDLEPLYAAGSELVHHNGTSVLAEGSSNPHPSAGGVTNDVLNYLDNGQLSGWPAIDTMAGEDVLNWAFLGDDALWNLEAGLGEYVYGDLQGNEFLGGFDFGG